MKDTLPNLQFLGNYKHKTLQKQCGFPLFLIMLLHDLLAPQGFKDTVLPTQLPLVDFEDYELSEDMKRNSIQWEYFCQ